MLYSAKYKFIFIKSVKTASTSAEGALEFLISNQAVNHATNSALYADGSRIGYRGGNPSDDPNFGQASFSLNHMSAADIRALVGESSFHSAVKISSIRQPYDRCISAFHHLGNHSLDDIEARKRYGGTELIKRDFHDFLNADTYDGTEHFYCDKKMIIDRFIRQEFLKEDLKAVLDMLSVSADIAAYILGNIPTFKMKRRKYSFMRIIDYYDDTSLSIVNKRFCNWFALGGYEMAHSLDDLKNL
ncbi:MAG: sulfotransferase family 2 domain-containing protein [bacterium]